MQTEAHGQHQTPLHQGNHAGPPTIYRKQFKNETVTEADGIMAAPAEYNKICQFTVSSHIKC